MTTSPLRYPGGKTRACKKLDEIFINNFTNIKTIISPFIGGGSFELYLMNKYNVNIIANDKFKPLYSFWNTCKLNKIKLYNILNTCTSITKEQFIQYRNIIMTEEDELKQAYYYFIINRCSFNGSTLSGGFSQEASIKRFTKSSIEKINTNCLDKFSISNKDFEDFLLNNNNNESLLFLDPPYYLEVGSKLYGFSGDMHETFDHKKLYYILSSRNNWMMTYNDCKYIRDLYKDFIIMDVDWSYGMNKSKKSSEIVILCN